MRSSMSGAMRWSPRAGRADASAHSFARDRIGKGRGRCFEVGEHVEHVHVRSAPPSTWCAPITQAFRRVAPTLPRGPRNRTNKAFERCSCARSCALSTFHSDSTALPQPFHALSTRCPRAWEACVMCSCSCVLDRELHACDPLCHKAFERCSCARSCALSTCAHVLRCS